MPGPLDPKLIKCKFCRKDVRYDKCGGRVWEADRDEFHSPNCPRRQSHFKNEAAIRSQAKRESPR